MIQEMFLPVHQPGAINGTSIRLEFTYEPLVVLRYFSIPFHITSIYLLYSVYKKARDKIQFVLLINLSIVHFVVSVLDIVRCGSSFKPCYEYPNAEYTHWVLIFRESIEVFVYYFTIYIITFHRLMKVVLGLRYPAFIDIRKTKIVIFGLWLFAFLVSFIVGILHINDVILEHRKNTNVIERHFYRYLFTPLDIAYFLLFILSYCSILKKQNLSLQRSQRCPRQRRGNVRSKRLYYIPFLLLTNFLVFVVIPDLMYVFSSLSNEDSKFHTWIAYLSFYTTTICHMHDAVIYTFIHPYVRKFLWNKVKPLCYSCCSKMDFICLFLASNTADENRRSTVTLQINQAAVIVKI